MGSSGASTFLLILGLSVSLVEGVEKTWWRELWYPQMPVDHFSFGPPATFSLRYLVNDSNWKAGGPIFFYCGNEGAIDLFALNTGFMWDIAPQFGAMLVFAEHRYYGKTMPFGNASFKSIENRAFLSSEQALADYSVLLTNLKSERKSPESKIIAFGGSYGGMLAAWFRIKYPHVVTGSIAASAPILQFRPVTPCWTYSSIVTRTFSSSGVGCDKSIRRSWKALRNLAASSDGRKWINSQFNFCNDSTLSEEKDVDAMVGWLAEIWNNLPMIDYPYATNFLNPVPAYPVFAACRYLNLSKSVDDKTLLTGIYNAASIFLNYTGQTECYKFSETTGNLDAVGWNFQACTEMVMPMCNNGTDMFEPSPWDLKAYNDSCFRTYGIYARPDWVLTNYGGTKLDYASNIVFSNGDLDPWSGGGVTVQPKNKGITVISVKHGAHHYDMRSANPQDTQSVRNARKQEIAMIKLWLQGPSGSKRKWTKGFYYGNRVMKGKL